MPHHSNIQWSILYAYHWSLSQTYEMPWMIIYKVSLWMNLLYRDCLGPNAKYVWSRLIAHTMFESPITVVSISYYYNLQLTTILLFQILFVTVFTICYRLFPLYKFVIVFLIFPTNLFLQFVTIFTISNSN